VPHIRTKALFIFSILWRGVTVVTGAFKRKFGDWSHRKRVLFVGSTESLIAIPADFRSPSSAPPTLPSPAAILVLRCAHTIGDGSSSYEQVHDYLASELDRLVRMGAGALVLNGVADLLIVAKARLLRTDALFPLADLISNNLHQLPGLGR